MYFGAQTETTPIFLSTFIDSQIGHVFQFPSLDNLLGLDRFIFSKSNYCNLQKNFCAVSWLLVGIEPRAYHSGGQVIQYTNFSSQKNYDSLTHFNTVHKWRKLHHIISFLAVCRNSSVILEVSGIPFQPPTQLWTFSYSESALYHPRLLMAYEFT